MGFIIGHRVKYNGLGVLKCQLHLPSKNLPMTPPPQNFYPTTPQPPSPWSLLTSMSYWVRYGEKLKGPCHIIATWHFFRFIEWKDSNKNFTITWWTNINDGWLFEKDGINLKQMSDPNRNPSKFPIIFFHPYLIFYYCFICLWAVIGSISPN